MQKFSKMMLKTFNINVTRNQETHTLNITELEKEMYDTFPSCSLRNEIIHVQTTGWMFPEINKLINPQTTYRYMYFFFFSLC